MSVWNKLDSGLASIYANYLRVREHGPAGVATVHRIVAEGGRLNISLQYTGDLATIEAAGFHTIWKHPGGNATGTVDLADLERLAELPEVLKMSFGRPPRPSLDVSVPDIRARQQVWSINNGTFSGNTGAGVIVAVVDTGIDFRHSHFLKADGTTRILRIWDQGLLPGAGESSPDPARLTGPTYGVEYTDAMINAVLQGTPGATNVRHRDCVGHGTHCASIAAGNGRITHWPTRSNFKYIGVAPEADIIAVKILSPETEPRVGGVEVPWPQKFRDAITYVLKTAHDVFSKPVAINCSFGNDLGAHDGFSETEDFLTDKFATTTGQVVVCSAGNDAGSNQHARIEFPAGASSVDIPFRLYDPRTNRMDWDKCQWLDQTESVFIQLYYPDGPTKISVSLQLPGGGAPIAGPAFGAAAVSGPFGPRHYVLTHNLDSQTLITRGTVNRDLFQVEIQPANHEHRLGTYTLHISSPDALTVHVWCDQSDYGFVIDESNPLPANVHVEDRFLIGTESGGDNVISVAAYDPTVATLDIADFSSRGPLANYGGGPAQPDKPDIGAPGVHIHAASAHDAKAHRKKKDIIEMQGTSMAAPHVTGTAALMLERDHGLTVAQIISTLKGHCRTSPPATAEELGAGRLDAKDAFDNTP
jgi:subtilisin family serine protease